VAVAEVAEATVRAEAEVPHPEVPHPVGRADPVDPEVTAPEDQVDLVAPDRADRANMDLAVPVGLVAPVRECTGLVVLVVLVVLAAPVTTVPECAGPVVLAVPVAPAVLGMAMTTAATSTAHPGETDPHPGVQASRRIPTGADRFPRRVDGGAVARSTTTATTRTRCGIKDSTSGASTSSESGSRCKESPHTTPASPIGEAGVVFLATHNCIQVEMTKTWPVVMRRI
jgi:hypothetical protein